MWMFSGFLTLYKLCIYLWSSNLLYGIIAVRTEAFNIHKTFINIWKSFFHLLSTHSSCLPNSLLQFPVSTSVCFTCVPWFDDVQLTVPRSLDVGAPIKYLVMSGMRESWEFPFSSALILMKIWLLFCSCCEDGEKKNSVWCFLGLWCDTLSLQASVM